ncbi:hypothetical protein VTK26DRAFT_5066 [Humicola hyalothermophila]
MCRFAGETDSSYQAVFRSIERIAKAFNDKSRARGQRIDMERTSVRSSLRSFDDYEKSCVALFRPFDISDYQSSLTRAADDTCEWILNHPVFVSWLAKSESALLWLRGHPGCGKTVLSCYLANRFQSEKSPFAPQSVWVFFCDEKISTQRNANAVLLGLIYQAICQHRSLIRHVKKAFDVQGQNLTRSFSALWRICLAIMSDPKCGPTWVIIDALDECEPSTRRILLDSIHGLLAGSSPAIGIQNCVKFILASRPTITVFPETGTAVKPIADYRISIDEDKEGYPKALRAFILQRVAEISQRLNFTVDMTAFLRENLLSQAGETFLWVHIMLATFGKQSARVEASPP